MAFTDRLESTASRAIFGNTVLFGGCLAALMSANSITVLCYSSVGISGNTIFTGVMLATYLTAILILNFRSDIVIGTADYLFASFLFCVVASSAANGRTADPKEWEIFAVSLAAYPACRFLSIPRLQEARTAFNWTTVIVVALGTIITTQALFTQWNDPHGKPIVGGFDAAATMFLGSLGFLLISLLTSPLTWRKTTLISVCIFLPMAVFAASQVRFTFVAIVGSLCLAAIFSSAKQRKHIAVIVLVVVAGTCTGLVARSGTTKAFLAYAIEKNLEKPTKIGENKLFSPPSCSLEVNQYNSVAQRKALIQDALYLIPLAGAFGFGLDSFMGLSCLSLPAHNSALQALVEFGWLGGSALALLVLLSLARLFPAARRDCDVRFVLCSLSYIVVLSLAHGRTSRDILLFALLGLTAGISETCRVRQNTDAPPTVRPEDSRTQIVR